MHPFRPSLNPSLNLALALALHILLPAALPAQFTRVTTDSSTAGPLTSTFGCAWGDYNADGLPDLFLANFNSLLNGLYPNQGNAAFLRVAPGPFATDGGNTSAASWGDYDNDGHQDIYIANWNGVNFLYHNDGNGNFTKVTSGNIATDAGTTYGCAMADYDRDGFLDVFASNNNQNNFLYHNNGNGTFTKVISGSVVTDGGSSRSAAWGDYDNDGFPDLFVCNITGNNFLYHNDGNGSFTKITTGSIVTDGGNSYGCSWGDYDRDGDLDLYVVNGNYENNFLYRNDGNGSFTRITIGPHVNDGGRGRASAWVDFDNDGDLDLFVGNWALENNMLFRNDNGSFVQLSSNPITTDGGHSMGTSWADVDRDGDLDCYVANDFSTANFYYLNNGNSNNWVAFELVGVFSNRSAIGAKVRLKSGGVWQMLELSGQTGHGGQNSLTAHFGLGSNTSVDSLLIQWPSCLEQVILNPAINTFHTVPELAFLQQPGDTNLCEGSSGTLQAQGNSVSGLLYQWHYQGSPLSNGGNISGATSSSLGLSPLSLSDAGAYHCVVSLACNPAFTLHSDTAMLGIANGFSATDSASICPGDSFLLPSGDWVTAAGSYLDTLPGPQCDSFITTVITVLPGYQQADSVLICQGDSFLLPSGSWVHAAGTYMDTLPGAPCDSVFVTVLAVEICTGIRSGMVDGFTIYPNPATSAIDIEFGQPQAISVSIAMMDLNGRVLRTWETETGHQHVHLDLGQLPSGIYWLAIKVEDRHWYRKVVVQR